MVNRKNDELYFSAVMENYQTVRLCKMDKEALESALIMHELREHFAPEANVSATNLFVVAERIKDFHDEVGCSYLLQECVEAVGDVIDYGGIKELDEVDKVTDPVMYLSHLADCPEDEFSTIVLDKVQEIHRFNCPLHCRKDDNKEA